LGIIATAFKNPTELDTSKFDYFAEDMKVTINRDALSDPETSSQYTADPSIAYIDSKVSYCNVDAVIVAKSGSTYDINSEALKDATATNQVKDDNPDMLATGPDGELTFHLYDYALIDLNQDPDQIEATHKFGSILDGDNDLNED